MPCRSDRKTPAAAVIVLFGALILGAMGSARGAPPGPTTAVDAHALEAPITPASGTARKVGFAMEETPEAMEEETPEATGWDARRYGTAVSWLGALSLLGGLLVYERRSNRKGPDRRRPKSDPGPVREGIGAGDGS
jgi:hypothetical protein